MNPRRVLILTELGDIHAYAVAHSLELKGAKVTLWHTSDFPMLGREAILFENGNLSFYAKGPLLNFGEDCFDSIWHRRPSYVVNEELLHPADFEFSDHECNVFRKSFLSLFAPEAFWVNPPDAAAKAGRKPVQQSVARRVGLRIPATLYTNDPDEIRSFINRHDKQIVYKPFRSVSWKNENTYKALYTSLLTNADLVEDHLLQSVPGIYQELLPKDFELRITVIGGLVFGAKILSQETNTGRLDWRKAYHELRIEPYEVPLELANQCRKVLASLNLVFGCFDFVVTPTAEVFFLEVNEMGQFLFLEQFAGLPLLDAFVEFLLQSRSDFKWSQEDCGVNYREVVEVVREKYSKLSEIHVPAPDRAIQE